MIKHTTGPWKCEGPDEFGDWTIQQASDSDGSDGILAIAAIISNLRKEEKVAANAHLIASAPDLLEACEEFVRKCECGEARSRRSYAQMKMAIAKAKGETGK